MKTEKGVTGFKMVHPGNGVMILVKKEAMRRLKRQKQSKIKCTQRSYMGTYDIGSQAKNIMRA